MASPDPQETTRRAKGLLTIARLTGRLARTALGKRGFNDAAIIARWPEIVGADLATFACPLQIKYPRGRNDAATLVLKTPQIVARVNGFLGYAAVSRLEASHGPLPQRPPKAKPTPDPAPDAVVEAATANVASEDLRNALRKLGSRLQHRRADSVVGPADRRIPGKD